MAVDKNFVVKNGLEVNTDLILANAVTNQVGIATTVTKYTLHVNGGIGATNLSVTGVSTFHQIVLDGTVSAGSTTGSVGQYLKSTGTGVAWDSFPVGRTSTTFTASASQNTFNFTYAVGLVDVFVNGIKLTPVEFTASDGVTIVLSSPCFGGEIVDIHAYSVSGLGVGATGITGLTIQDEGILIGNPQGVTSINFIGAAITAAASGAGLTISHVDKWGQTSAGISTTLNVGLGTTNPRFSLEVGPVGYADTALWVNGNARITGILTVGTSSIVLDGNNNTLTVPNLVVTNSTTGVTASGAGVTVRDGGGNLGSASIIDFGDNLSVTFSSGIATITGSAGGGGSSQWVTTATGIHTLSNVGIGTTNATSTLTVKGNTSLETLNVSGVSTFQNNVNLLDDDRLYFGTDQDIFIGHQTIPSPINYIAGANNVPLTIWADNLTLGAQNGENFATFTTNGSASLYYDNSKKFETLGTGVTVTGTTFTNQLSVSGSSTLVGNVGIGTTNAGEKLQVDGNIRVGISTTSNYIAFRGTSFDGPLNVGGELPYQHTYIGERIYDYSGSEAERSELLLFKGNDTAGVAGPDRIRLFAGEHRFDVLGFNTTGTFEQVGVSTAAVNKLTITSTGVGIGTTNPTSALTVKGTSTLETLSVSGVSTFNGYVNFGSALGIGTNSTESIIQSTSSSQFLITNTAGPINLKSNEINLISSPVGSPEYLLRGFGDGSVELYHDNSKKFETIGAGVTITGTTFTNQLSVSGVSTFNSVAISSATSVHTGTNNRLIFGNDLEILSSGGINYVSTNENPLSLGVRVQDGGPVIEATLGLVNIYPGNDVYYGNNSYVTLGFGTDGNRLQTIGAGVTVTGTTFTNQLSVSGVSTFNGSDNYFSGNIICSSYAGPSRIILTGGTGGDTNLYNGGTSYSDFIFTTLQGGSSREIARINRNGVLSLPYADGGLNVVGVSTFVGNVGVGTTNATSKLTVRGGDISVGVSTAHGVILTSPNGTQYRLIVANDGTLSTTAV